MKLFAQTGSRATIASTGASLLCALFVAGTVLTLPRATFAAAITVPNGDFSSTPNNGSIGSGVIGGSGSGPIGVGPWDGNYSGVLGLLAPPALTIANQRATLAGLAGIDLLGIANNSGFFSQDLNEAFTANRRYLLSANIDAGYPLSLGVLNDSNAGLALTDDGVVVASTASSSNISLSLLSGTSYRLTLEYSTSASASGNIGVRLFAMPQNLVTADLLTSVSFSDVALSQSAINPLAAGIGSAGGTPQGATVNAAFAAPLAVQVVDSLGDPVSGVSVSFQAPGSGASATLSTTSAATDLNGLAQITATANAIAGAYSITASVDGVGTTARFDLTNIAGAVSSVGASTGTPQSATVNTAFSTALGVIVTDASNNPVPGITVRFTAPNAGASATFPSGATATTDASGLAQVSAGANTVAGTYTVSASVNGASAIAVFALSNGAGPAALALPIGGTPQNATVSSAFATPLGVLVTDAYGNPSNGVSVTFTAPVNGASAAFPPDGTVTTIVTGPDGIANANAVANSTPGSYQITADFSGQTNQTVFNLTNAALPQPHGTSTSGDGQGASPNAAFQCALQLKVTDAGGIAMSGVSIQFVAPATGPSASLSDGINSGTQVTTTTDANGLTSVAATANAIAGSYAISAGVAGSDAALASYTLTNLDANDRMFTNGFDTMPSLCAGN